MSATQTSVLVTRPPHQAESLCRALEAAGLQPIRLPVIDIQGLDFPQPTSLSTLDWLIFTSPNAVHHGQTLIQSLPAQVRLAAIGAATALAVQKLTGKPVTSPATDYSTEGLLAEPEFSAPRGLHITIIKGQGGRDSLAPALRTAGATVDELCVYRRIPLTPTEANVSQAIQMAQAAIITSGEILLRLVELTPPTLRTQLLTLQLVVPSARVVQMAHSEGFLHVRQVPSPLNEAALVQAVLTPQTDASAPG